jgi:hypothetical protein
MWSSLQCAPMLGGQPGREARGLIERAVHRSGLTLTKGQLIKIPPPTKKTAWAHTAELTHQNQKFRGKDRENPGPQSGFFTDAFLRKINIISPVDFAANEVLRL